MPGREAIINLALYGYGVVRNIRDVAVTVPTRFGTVVLSNDAFTQFLKLEEDNERKYQHEAMA